jgi:hypothetical protein
MWQSRNLNITLHDGRLTVKSSYMGVFFAMLWTAALIGMLFKETRSDIGLFLNSPFELAVSAILLGTGAFAMLPRRIITSFDERNLGIIQTRIIAGVWTWRTRRYAFSDIAGVGVQECNDEGKDVYYPIITLNGGRVVGLIYEGESRSVSAEAVGQICAETGLPRLDVSWRDERNDDRSRAASTTQTTSTAE